ncbi:hypothetical protein [Thiocystis violacea]|uniref:hypothetical protein n=1 Tax=Thiocystis violacea TaxID=13725 RepID=UPI0019057C08|nr:hypothetical protein [Thiocystis violacea]
MALLLQSEAKAAYPANFYQIDPFSDFPILADQGSENFKISDSIYAEGCAGERIHVSIIVRPETQSFQGLKMDIGPLKNAASEINEKLVDTRIVKIWYQSKPMPGRKNYHRRADPRERILIPELLLHDESLVLVDKSSQHNSVKLHCPAVKYKNISIELGEEQIRTTSLRFPGGNATVEPNSESQCFDEFPVRDLANLSQFELIAGENKQFLITIAAPEDAVPGEYQTNLRVSDASEKTIILIPLKLKIFDFKLEKSSLSYSIYYRGQLPADDKVKISSDKKSETQLTAELKDLVSHGVTNPTVYQKIDDKTLFERYLRLRQITGAVGSELFIVSRQSGPENTEVALAGLEADVLWLKKVITNYGFTVPYIYGKDEAHDDGIDQQLASWKMVQQAGGKNFSSGYQGHFERSGSLTDLLIFHGDNDTQERDKAHSLGSKIFSYHNPQVGADIPQLFRLNYGLQLWKNGFDGAMPYAYQHPEGFIWNDFDDAIYKDHALTYPTVDGVISTLSWEAFGAGIDDVRYVSTLESIVNNENSSLSAPVLKEANELLNALRSGSITPPAEIRRNIAQMLLKVHEELKSTN